MHLSTVPFSQHAGKQRSLKMWLAGAGPASQRSGSQVLDSEDSLPEMPLTAQAASEGGVPTLSQAQTGSMSTDLNPSRLSAQRELSGGGISAQSLLKRQEPLPRASAPAAVGRKGKRGAAAAGESLP